MRARQGASAVTLPFRSIRNNASLPYLRCWGSVEPQATQGAQRPLAPRKAGSCLSGHCGAAQYDECPSGTPWCWFCGTIDAPSCRAALLRCIVGGLWAHAQATATPQDCPCVWASQPSGAGRAPNQDHHKRRCPTSVKPSLTVEIPCPPLPRHPRPPPPPPPPPPQPNEGWMTSMCASGSGAETVQSQRKGECNAGSEDCRTWLHTHARTCATLPAPVRTPAAPAVFAD